jgi:hypothetical protein
MGALTDAGHERMTLILVHTAHPQALEHAGDGFGRLLSPRHFGRVADTAAAGIPWAADNDCFQRLDVPAYRRMLAAVAGLPGCRFIVAPDVVGDWLGTRARWDEWAGEVAATGQPPAYVIQDGQPADAVPWDNLGALFVGGTTAYKLSPDAEQLGREAKARGLWLHMGRVNSRRRFDYARATGCDSVDGSGFSKWRRTTLPRALEWHRDHLQERIPA